MHVSLLRRFRWTTTIWPHVHRWVSHRRTLQRICIFPVLMPDTGEANHLSLSGIGMKQKLVHIAGSLLIGVVDRREPRGIGSMEARELDDPMSLLGKH